MTFTFRHAAAIIQHYRFLKGRDMQEGNSSPITDLVIAPLNDDKLNKFFSSFAGDAAAALETAGYNGHEVQVIAINETGGKIDLWEEIDSYLERNHLDRVYLNPDFFNA